MLVFGWKITDFAFNKVCYTLRLQGCFLLIYEGKYYASAGGYEYYSNLSMFTKVIA
jgi:hypothetical protein